ncbi:MAG: excinuclease ABC subunit C, partial [Sphaerochaetaceae bacterium]|nr:excinuclease ABC subunit C [Sphaerochaetaceae bacterium]
TAARKRDLLQSLQSVSFSQQVEDFSYESRDYAACEMRMHLATVSMLQIRDGKLMGKALYRAETLGDETDTLLHFLTQYYKEGGNVPQKLFLSHDVDSSLIKTFLKEEMHYDIEVTVPTEGKHYRVLRMSRENASRDVEKRLKGKENPEALEELMNVLDLEDLPVRIEGFDIAQLSGKYTVASLISFVDGHPDKKNYRRFNIRSLNGKIDDFASIREAVTRRYSRQLKENRKLPDLIMVDGGQGQVNSAKSALIALGLDSIPLIGLAEKLEEIYFPDEREVLRLPEDSPALHVLIAVRDETHRFATSLNQLQRSKDATFSLLESIPGVGPARSKRLMKSYSTLDEILNSNPQEVAGNTHIPLEVIERIIKTLNL